MLPDGVETETVSAVWVFKLHEICAFLSAFLAIISALNHEVVFLAQINSISSFQIQFYEIIIFQCFKPEKTPVL